LASNRENSQGGFDHQPVTRLWGDQPPYSPSASRSSIATRKTNIGLLMLQYNGGGHENAGACQIDNDKAEAVLVELIARITRDG
jgi:nanoRNase/pAp phosphatase (c-di-AMP/oligoRNAs hydrolase)